MRNRRDTPKQDLAPSAGFKYQNENDLARRKEPRIRLQTCLILSCLAEVAATGMLAGKSGNEVKDGVGAPGKSSGQKPRYPLRIGGTRWAEREKSVRHAKTESGFADRLQTSERK
jgi:hypothetical protein